MCGTFCCLHDGSLNNKCNLLGRLKHANNVNTLSMGLFIHCQLSVLINIVYMQISVEEK